MLLRPFEQNGPMLVSDDGRPRAREIGANPQVGLLIPWFGLGTRR